MQQAYGGGCGLLLPAPPLLIPRFELLLQLLVHLLPAQCLQVLEKSLRASRYLPHIVILPLSVPSSCSQTGMHPDS